MGKTSITANSSANPSTSVAFTSATIQLFEDSDGKGVFEIPGELVQTVNVTFSPPTSNGPVPGSGFTFTTTP